MMRRRPGRKPCSRIRFVPMASPTTPAMMMKLFATPFLIARAVRFGRSTEISIWTRIGSGDSHGDTRSDSRPADFPGSTHCCVRQPCCPTRLTALSASLSEITLRNRRLWADVARTSVKGSRGRLRKSVSVRFRAKARMEKTKRMRNPELFIVRVGARLHLRSWYGEFKDPEQARRTCSG